MQGGEQVSLALGSLALRLVKIGNPLTHVLLHDGADSDIYSCSCSASVGDLHGLLVHIDAARLQKEKVVYNYHDSRIRFV